MPDGPHSDERKPPIADGCAGDDELIAFRANSREPAQVVPAPARRDWMPETPGQSARWCLPLLLANASGWEVLSPMGVTAMWDGGPDTDAVHVETDVGPETDLTASSQFGHGIVTFTIPFLMRTAAGRDLLVRGPANRPKDGVSPLEGLVETDWAVMPFTMNWQLTRPGTPVRWEPGEPVCLLVPYRRGDLEAIRPYYRSLRVAPETRALARLALEQRELQHRRTETAAVFGLVRRGRDRFERLYFRGRYPDGQHAPTHRAAVRLRPFNA